MFHAKILHAVTALTILISVLLVTLNVWLRLDLVSIVPQTVSAAVFQDQENVILVSKDMSNSLTQQLVANVLMDVLYVIQMIFQTAFHVHKENSKILREIVLLALLVVLHALLKLNA